MCRTPLWCCAEAPGRRKKISSNSLWPTVRPTSIHAASFFFNSCRSPALTKLIRNACASGWRKDLSRRHPMSDEAISIEKLQELIMRGPFNQWLNFTTVSAGEDGVEIKAAWREAWVVHPERRFTHGGILAAIVDVAADYAIAASLGRPVPTIALRLDYRQGGMPGAITAKARVVRMGGQFSTAEAYLYDKEGALVD